MSETMSAVGARPVRAPRGSELSCRGWEQEAALRMLMNNLDPEVAEDPDHLVVYGGTGRAARSWDAFDAIVRELRRLEGDETLLVQSGKPVGVVRTHPWAPRVLIANSNLVGKWATWEVFRELERDGLMMYGQMTAGSWIYIGTQGILQGTYETFAEAARQHFGGTLRGTVTLTAGLGGMGGAQPMAVTMNEGVCIVIEVDEARARRRLDIGYVDRLTADPAEALAWARAAAVEGVPLSIALVGNAAEVEPAWAAAGERFDLVTDQTSAHDALGGYVPDEMTLADALVLRATQPDEYQRRARALDGRPRPRDARLPARRRGRVRLRQQPARAGPGGGRRRRVRLPGVRAGLHPAAVLRGPRPVPLGRAVRATPPTSPARTGPSSSSSPTTPASTAGSRWPRRASRSRACRPGSAGSATASGRRPVSPSTSWSRAARSARPSSSGATTSTRARSPHPTARPRRCATARTRSPTGRCSTPSSTPPPAPRGCRSTTAAASGSATSQHAGMVVVADGTPLAAQKLERVLTTDPAMGVLRHVDAGYERAIEVARERGIRVPMLDDPTG